ncbi:MAG TPA: metallophosphoesterase family protein [Dehalococcoidales bacterium]|jgi:diadenosine tetraphosphatase ApaH/serine/threonine PP2A family protein phosphatase
MKYAILADIHANLTALEAVIQDIQGRGGVDEMWCLGDIVGYGPDPRQCIDLIRQRCSACVAGNHDWATIRKIGTVEFNLAAGEAIEWTRKQVRPEDVEYLESLPLTIEIGDFTLTHGSPHDPIWEYVLSEAEARENLKSFKTRYCLVGHSHLPLLFECEKSCTLSEPADGTMIKLGKKRLIINPGSVGQPRDNDPRASYAVYNEEPGTITLHRVKYDIAAVQLRMGTAGLPEKLIDRLVMGQ